MYAIALAMTELDDHGTEIPDRSCKDLSWLCDGTIARCAMHLAIGARRLGPHRRQTLTFRRRRS